MTEHLTEKTPTSTLIHEVNLFSPVSQLYRGGVPKKDYEEERFPLSDTP